MTKPNIVIVGAGIAGSALAALMRRQGLRPKLLDKNPKPPGHSYGISLDKSLLSQLLFKLETDEHAVLPQMLHPTISNTHLNGSTSVPSESSSVRVSRALFEDFLRQDLDVDWNCKVANVETSSSSSALSLNLEDGRVLSADLVVAADGVHSSVRNSLLPKEQPKVLPYAVFNGRKNVSLKDAREIASKLASGQNNNNSTHTALIQGTRLALEIYKYQDQATLDFTFSRLAGSGDKLHRPDRPQSGARDIPEELFAEVDGLDSKPAGHDLVFASSSLRDSRLLHWLMRQHLVSQESLKALVSRHVVLVGDAAHAQPIIGGNGANVALQDALTLSTLLTGNHLEVAQTFYDMRFDAWSQAAAVCEQNIKQMHSLPTSSL